MQRTTLFVIGAVFLGIGAAQADDRRDRDDHHHRRGFDLECKFRGDILIGKDPKGGIVGEHRCYVRARVCNFRQPLDFLDGDRERDDHHCRNRDFLEVWCDNGLIYKDDVFHDSAGEFEFLTARGHRIGGPAIVPVGPGKGVIVDDDLILKYVSERGHDFDDHDDDDKHDRDRDRHRHDDAFIVSSWLKVGPLVMEGVCAAERLHEHDRDDHRRHDGPPAVAPTPHLN